MTITKKYQSIKKSRKKDRLTIKNKVEELKNKVEMSLFDISTCKCTLFLKCNCPKEKQIPKEGQDVLKDRRKTKKIAIVGLESK